MTILVQQLRELCDKATQGDWWIDSHGRQLVAHNPFSSIFITHGEAMGPATRHPETGYLSHWPNDWDASYIVAVQPKVVRGLLDEIDRLTRAAKYCEDIDATHENHRETMLYDMAVERDQLKAENAELRPDALRFRHVLQQLPANLSQAFCGENVCHDDEIIEAIDQAMTKEGI